MRRLEGYAIATPGPRCGDFDPSATHPAYFRTSRRFFTLGSFFLSYCLAALMDVYPRFPSFSPRFFRGSPLPEGTGSAFPEGFHPRRLMIQNCYDKKYIPVFSLNG
jgi:hypothetical protein